MVLSDMRACSNSAIAPRIWKNILPTAVEVLDSVWLTERGMLRPSFVPPAEIRRLRDYTRLRLDLTQDRTRYWQRLEKLLEDALIKVSSVASKMDTASVRDMIEALIGGERDPRVLARLARGRMRAKNAALIEALNGSFDDHHAELAQMLLDQIDVLTAKVERLTVRVEELIGAIPPAQAPDIGGPDDDGGGQDPAAVALPALDRLDEVPGIGRRGAQVILAEIGLDMTRFPTAGHLVSWAKLCPATIQSGPNPRTARPARATPTSKVYSGRSPPRPPRPRPSSANGTGGWSNGWASSKPWSRSLAPPRDHLTCSTTPPAATGTWAPTSIRAAPTLDARPATTSASSRPSGSRSPLHRVLPRARLR
jgi:hypothetical protein